MSLLPAFVRTLPSAWSTCPIYAKGAKLPSGNEACGKSPLGATHHQNWSPAETALHIERYPEVFKAVGVFTGPRSQGLVILDIDANLAQLKKKWGADLDAAPVVRSAKKNAAKYFFYVPREYWGEVCGLSLSASNEGWEVLWGRQGLVGGAYKDEGFYSHEGDFDDIPKAPEWLLAYMKESHRGKQNSDDVKKDPRYGMRSAEELELIVKNCLSVIQPQGRNSEDQWWRIGAMIHSELPNEKGLDLWRKWSQRDDEYADDWVNNDPCANRWDAGFKVGGGLGLGSLIDLADHYDPDRKRFLTDAATKQLIEDINQQTVSIRQSVPPFKETIEKAQKYLKYENPAERNYNLNALALQAGYRDQDALEKLVVDQLQFEDAKGLMGVQDLFDTDEKRDYLIPDILPHPSVVLIYGAGGDGKSMTAWTLSKHIATGASFIVRGKAVPVEKGPVVLLNGDQPLVQLKEQLQEVDYPADSDTFIQTDWSLQHYAQFRDLMHDVKPKLVVIDSLIGCSGGRAFDENKSDFATPLYWLTRNNGVSFPATTIVIIHHANKQGGFRGTSAIRDAVDEVWSLKKPDNTMGSLPSHCRLISIEKSRSGRSGTQLVLRMEDDLTFSLSDYTPEVDSGNTAPSSITDRVLQRLRVIYPRTAARTDLNADPVIGGKVAAIGKALQRLVKRGLVVESFSKNYSGDSRYRNKVYQAVLACGALQGTVPSKEIPSAGTDVRVDNQGGQKELSTLVDAEPIKGGQPPAETAPCPPSKVSGGAESGQGGHSGQYPRARGEERTEEELKASKDKAWDIWS